MGIISEDAVVIKKADKIGDYSMISINCPDKTGLGCDLCRIILLFGLNIVRGDMTTDGKWCYIVFWVVDKPTTRWDLLKMRLLEVCPTCSASESGIYYYKPEFQQPKPLDVFLLNFCCAHDRKGLLHDVTEVLCKLELTIKRVKISTAPDGSVMCLFFITDTRELLHTNTRREETIDILKSILGDTMISCEIESASPEVTACSQIFLPPSIREDMFSLELPGNHLIKVENSLSRSHTLIQIFCRDHKGLAYDVMRTLKDYNIQVSYGRFSPKGSGNCEMEVFVVQADGKKITDPQKQNALLARLRMELVCPLRMEVVSRGPDTELIVVNPVELSGRGRPLVFRDVTRAMRILNIHIFSVEIGRHISHDREWEVYRILLDERTDLLLSTNAIKERVRKELMGWD